MASIIELPETHHHDDDDEMPHVLSKRFMDHANAPRHMGSIENADGMAKGVGSCGDALTVYLTIRDHQIVDIKQHPHGCTYTVACGSAMSQLVRDKSLTAALTVTPDAVADELGGLPADHMHCAALAVNTLGEAIDDYYQKIWGRAEKQP